MKHLLSLAVALLLGACATDPNDIGREPRMSAVGRGLTVEHEPMPNAFPAGGRRAYNSLWDQSAADLFQDPRARRVGDVVTINILIDDKAQFDNATDRSRNSKSRLGFNLGFDFNGRSVDYTAEGDIRSGTSTEGQGSIDRSEKLRLSVAAVVTEVLPNGNLLISGSQEIRVNFEVRVLNIAGIARPSDISRKNTIAYDKIAEARVSYGGRGRITEVQQPAVGQQIYDLLTPW